MFLPGIFSLRQIKNSAFSLVLILVFACFASGCETHNQFLTQQTHHGIIGKYSVDQLKNKTPEQLNEILGSAWLNCEYDSNNCIYYVSASSSHPYFKLPGQVHHVIYKICFNKSNKSETIEVLQNDSNVMAKRFNKSLKNQDKQSAGEIFSSIFSSSKLSVK